MRRVDCTQRSAEWFAIRAGRVTASRISDVLSKRRDGKEAADRANYKMELVAERLTGDSSMHYVSPYMMRGADWEDEAKAAYIVATGCDLDDAGFVLHPSIDYSGASPDALIVGERKGVEIKVPQIKTHLSWLMGKADPLEEYGPQMQWGMECCEYLEWDFVSYCRELPADLRLVIRPCKRDDKLISCVKLEVEQLLSEVSDMVSQLSKGVLTAA